MAAPIRTTTIRIKEGEFSGTSYTVTLEQDLLEDYTVEIVPQGTGDELQTRATYTSVRVTGDPFGDLGNTTASDAIELSRKATDNNTEHTIIIRECTDNSHGSGFIKRGVYEVSAADQVQTASATHSGVVDYNQCQVVVGGTNSTNPNSGEQNSAYVRARHDATNVEIERFSTYDHDTVEATLYLIEWGSSVSVELVELDSTFGAASVLSSTDDWLNVSISSVTATETYTAASFMLDANSNNGDVVGNIAWVLGDGVTVSSTENIISVGSQNGGSDVKGWIYVVSSPDWFVSRTKYEHGVAIGEDDQDTTFAIVSPTGSETYEDNTGDERTYGGRELRYRNSVLSIKISHSSAAVIPISDILASYHRLKNPFGAGNGAGVMLLEQIDFNGSPFGDENDIDGGLSTATANHASGIVIVAESTNITVTVKDSTGLNVSGTSVSAQVLGNTQKVTTTNSGGVASFTLSSTVSGVDGIDIYMGPSSVMLDALATVTLSFVEPPTNYYKREWITLGGVKDWQSTIPFTDVFLNGRGPAVAQTGESTNTSSLDLDASGWQMTTASGYNTSYYLSTEIPRFASGNYVCTYDGGLSSWPSTDVKMKGGVSETTKVHGQIDFSYDGSGHMYFNIKPTDASGMTSSTYIYNIKVLHEDDVATYDRDTNIWRQDYLDSLDDFSMLRMLDMGNVNNNPTVSWSQRPHTGELNTNSHIFRIEYPTVVEPKGAPLEWMIDLCNRKDCDIWIQIPHRADNDYVTQLATFVKANLNSGLRCYYELSNEMWNTQFSQTQYRNNVLIPYYGISGNSNQYYEAYTTRACEMFTLIDVVYGADLHLRERVLAGQSANTSMALALTEADVSNAVSPTLTGVASDHSDYYAIGAYMGGSVEETTAQEAFDAMVADSLVQMNPVSGDIVLNVSGLAETAKLKLCCYEIGQHLLAEGTQTAEVIRDANRLPAMRDEMYNHLLRWDTITNNAPFAPFSHVSLPNNSGAWGFSETASGWNAEPSSENYKAWAWKDWLATFAESVPGIPDYVGPPTNDDTANAGVGVGGTGTYGRSNLPNAEYFQSVVHAVASDISSETTEVLLAATAGVQYKLHGWAAVTAGSTASPLVADIVKSGTSASLGYVAASNDGPQYIRLRSPITFDAGDGIDLVIQSSATTAAGGNNFITLVYSQV
jgi:hypothetical protein